MKKISFKDLDLFDLEKLSRNDLKKITGGSMDRCGADFGPCPTGLCCSNYGYCGTGPDYCMDAGRCYTNTESCTLVVQSTSGGWNTYYGVCSGGDSCFCDIGQPVDIPITSNGGVSRCTIQ